MPVPAIAANKPVAWLGMVITAIPVVLTAMEPALPAVLAEKYPPASVAIMVAAFGGIVTAISAQAQVNAAPPVAPNV